MEIKSGKDFDEESRICQKLEEYAIQKKGNVYYYIFSEIRVQIEVD